MSRPLYRQLGIPTKYEGTYFASYVDCSMTGYKEVVWNHVFVLLAPVFFIFGLVKMLLPPYAGEALVKLGLYIISFSDWIGYLAAALYYILNEYGYGALFCKLSAFFSIPVIWIMRKLFDFYRWIEEIYNGFMER